MKKIIAWSIIGPPIVLGLVLFSPFLLMEWAYSVVFEKKGGD